MDISWLSKSHNKNYFRHTHKHTHINENKSALLNKAMNEKNV